MSSNITTYRVVAPTVGGPKMFVLRVELEAGHGLAAYCVLFDKNDLVFKSFPVSELILANLGEL